MRLRHLGNFIVGFSCGWFNEQLGGILISFCILIVLTIVLALLPEKRIKLFNKEFKL